VVDSDLLTSDEVIAKLGITLNNLRQLQFRKQLAWVKKEGRSVYYRALDVEAFRLKRETKRYYRVVRQTKS
jgi:hypothetical protein